MFSILTVCVETRCSTNVQVMPRYLVQKWLYEPGFELHLNTPEVTIDYHC